MKRELNLDHIYLDWAPERLRYSPPGRDFKPKEIFTPPNPVTHSRRLAGQVDQLKAMFAQVQERRTSVAELEKVHAQYIAVDFVPKGVKRIESFENARDKIELAVVQSTESEPDATAVLRLEAGRLKNLETKISTYGDPSQLTITGRSKNVDLLGGVTRFRRLRLRDLWTGDPADIQDVTAVLFWEVWLASNVNSAWFEQSAKRMGLDVFPGHELRFPDRTVVIARGTSKAMERAVIYLGAVMELRRPSLVKDFVEMPAVDQLAWVEDLIIIPPSEEACRICLLDDGIDRGHPLLAQALDQEAVLTYNRAWGVADLNKGHGTSMGGIAVFGEELAQILADGRFFEPPCLLESVKVLPEVPAKDPPLPGEVIQSAIAAVETTNPTADRVFCMAVTGQPVSDGAPTAWSAAMDQACAGSEEENVSGRVIVVSAGNAPWLDNGFDYPDSNQMSMAEDPAQAWNPLIVGAFTDFHQYDPVTFPEWDPVAPAGAISPTTTTALNWDRKKWPNRPDVVMEGGNLLESADGQRALPAVMSLLTARRRRIPGDRLLAHFGETSCATALAARLAALVVSAQETIRPETVRALIVHSARWTNAMLKEAPFSGRRKYDFLARTVGMGVPNLERAIYSAKDSLTMVLEGALAPYDENGQLATAHLHALPWPKETLSALSHEPVRMRVTLSYFIDPRPGKREYASKYRYASHGLRFHLKSSTESKDEFLVRINKRAREDGSEPTSVSDAPEWLLGYDARSRGSLHSDIWEGTAEDLAAKDHIAVIPVKGWWAEDKSKRKQEVRYSLVVSIETKEVNTKIDFHAEVTTILQEVEAAEVDGLGWDPFE